MSVLLQNTGKKALEGLFLTIFFVWCFHTFKPDLIFEENDFHGNEITENSNGCFTDYPKI